MRVHEQLNSYVEERGIKQSFISEKTGMNKDLVSRVLRGDRKLQADEFLKICEVLDIDPNMFRQKQ